MIALLALLGCSGCDASPVAGPGIKPGYAGSFYPSDAGALRHDVTEYMNSATTVDGLDAWAFISPHAGYVYSGPTAGHVYREISRVKPSRVVVVAFTHRPYGSGGTLRNQAIATTTAGFFKTPLGDLPVDLAEVGALLKEYPFITDDRALFDGEHSLEVQLPFIQIAAPDARIVPLMFGNQSDPVIVERLASVLAKHYSGDSRTTVVISTDMSHYFDYQTAVALDGNNLKTVMDLDCDGMKRTMNTPREGFCGTALVLTLMTAQRNLRWPSPVLLDYKNSGDTAGDRRKVVGYGAVAFPRPGGSGKMGQKSANLQNNSDTGPTVARPHDNELTQLQKKTLLTIARQTVETLIRTGRKPDFDVKDPVLARPGAAFVTLKKNGDLRGCIGHTEPRMPLWECVREMAVAAATEDPRFDPVRTDELAGIAYEISVLFPPVPVSDINEIVIGRDGLTIQLGPRRGLLLPQVPVEWGWNRQQFLEHTARKAGLPLDAWKNPDARLFRFEGIIFNEDDVGK